MWSRLTPGEHSDKQERCTSKTAWYSSAWAGLNLRRKERDAKPSSNMFQRRSNIQLDYFFKLTFHSPATFEWYHWRNQSIHNHRQAAPFHHPVGWEKEKSDQPSRHSFMTHDTYFRKDDIETLSLPWWSGCCLCNVGYWLDSLRLPQGDRPESWHHGFDFQSQTGGKKMAQT